VGANSIKVIFCWNAFTWALQTGANHATCMVYEDESYIIAVPCSQLPKTRAILR